MFQSDEEKFESDILKVDDEWRDYFRESRFYPEEIYSEMFEPNQAWNKWQQTKDYIIQVSI